ncbi:cytochrome P450 [Pleomassaria siparia CBS 279.74]|uniref:Cytochrome P450 n=1 Tax=Pleomassaria siparia CBS 279.74 TaxID=1314801 RepID=A0A6G1K5R8_9PLEO|nr:cytochrome P450 [Pleomassaria siparia CBS 279.74]
MALLIPLALLVSLILYYVVHTKTKNSPPPGYVTAPGPKGLPLLGNAHQLTLSPHRTILSWSRIYGDVYKIRLGWNDWYMLCSPDAVKEVLDRQSVHTSSRAPMPVAMDALSGGMRFLFMRYGDAWRRCRGVAHGLLTPRASALFKPSQEWEGKMLMEEILGKCVDGEGKGSTEAYKAVRRYTVSVMMTSTYGRRIPEWECDEVREIYGIMTDFSNIAAPGAYLADTLPPLGNLPPSLQWWRKGLKPYYDRQANLWMSLWSSLKTQVDTKQAPECFVKQVIESDHVAHGISELQAAFLAGSLIEAGSETTSAGINTAILYLAANPEVRMKAHEELSSVVGRSRSPTFEDEPNLPYIRAIVKETMRIRPVTNIGTPHYTMAPVIYKDIYIPANSIVAIQQYAIHYDAALFPDPETFKPERYLGFDKGSGAYAAGPANERDHWNFGAGRRICSGMHLAENSMFVVLAKVLWAFDVCPPVDMEGLDVSDEAFEQGANTVPKVYRVRWIARENAKEVILREAAEARQNGYVLRGERVTEAGVEY